MSYDYNKYTLNSNSYISGNYAIASSPQIHLTRWAGAIPDVAVTGYALAGENCVVCGRPLYPDAAVWRWRSEQAALDLVACATHGTTLAVESTNAVPPDAKYIPKAKTNGVCYLCTATTGAGQPIWWFRPDKTQKSRRWCGSHKQHDPATTVAGTTHKENDMAQRHNFTFTYTGAEIAASLEAQAVKLDEQATAVVKLDPATMEVLYPTEAARQDIIAVQERKVQRLLSEAASLRTEARPYAKAGSADFNLDLEDVEHFQLDSEDTVAAAPKRKRRLGAAAAKAAEEASTEE